MPPFKGLSRRDFLKLSALTSASLAIQPLAKLKGTTDQSQPHIIVIVYDAWSAQNVSLYGYSRPTMPNLQSFAEKAIVYHNHYSTAVFTVPGTASILTGTHPWTHRALSLGGRITPKMQQKQMFQALSPNLYTVGYAQNKYADFYLYQAGKALAKHINNSAFNLNRELFYSLPIFQKDSYIAFSSLDDNIFPTGYGLDGGSLFAGLLYRLTMLRQRLQNKSNFGASYYNDLLPDTSEQFILDDVVNGVIQTLKNLKEPSFVYLHLFPPHDPYRPSYEHKGAFDKIREPLLDKGIHPLSSEMNDYGRSKSDNKLYDEFLLTWDSALAKLYTYINDSGLRKKSYLFITSDHGEMFERGERGHMTPLVYRPVTHVPLIVSTPDTQSRIDVHDNTSSVDLLPTLASLSGNPRPDWSEGELLPMLGGKTQAGRSIYSMDAKKNTSFGPLTKLSLALTRDEYRMIYFHYPDYEHFELYNIANDPYEMHDLYSSKPPVTASMQAELIAKVAEINAPYKK